MSVAPGGHGMDEAELVGQFGQVREQLGNVFARLPARFEFVRAFGQVALFSLEGDEFVAAGHRLAVALDQFGFVIPSINVAARAGTEEEQNPFGFGSEMGRTRAQRVVRTNDRADWRSIFFRSEQSLVSQQCGQSDTAQAGSRASKELTAVEQALPREGHEGFIAPRRFLTHICNFAPGLSPDPNLCDGIE